MRNGGRTGLVVVAVVLVLGVLAVARAQAPAAGVLLRVGGSVARPQELTADGLARLPRQSLRVREHDGKDVEYQGVALGEVLKGAGVAFGHDLRGPALMQYLVVEASDGYRVVFALPELDTTSPDRTVLLADRRDGKPLDAKEGPLRLVTPGDKTHGRWVRQVISVKVGRAS
jgi:DMSO/TMAO reductase YedYZ molybdopterin-dependent catalytic subunit